MNANFENTTLEYEGLPIMTYDPYTGSGWDEFNSNGYVSGLMMSFQISPPAPQATVPGYYKPVPKFVFDKKFSNTDELLKEWRLHFPGSL